MNKFARVMYGKISHIYESQRTLLEFKQYFDPMALFIDVTNIEDVGIGYRVDFTSSTQFNLIPPAKIIPKTLGQVKKQKLKQIEMMTQSKIVGGFTSSASGEALKYDSDVPTQITMQGVAVNANSETFAQKYPEGCPVRGYKYGQNYKTIVYLNSEQVLKWCEDLSLHIGTCKLWGWSKQDLVNAAETIEQVNQISLIE